MAAARNPKGDKSGRGLASSASGRMGPACGPRKVEPRNRRFELWLLDTANRESGRPPARPGVSPGGYGAAGLMGACWALRRLKTALRWLQEVP